MGIVVVGLNHRSAPVEMREQFAFSDAEIPQALASMLGQGVAKEAVILSTCNRVEVYAATDGSDEELIENIQKYLLDLRNYTKPLNGEIYTLNEPASIIHLFRVATGLDSMALGETEIFGQLKKAYEIAFTNKSTGAFLNKAFQRAFNVAKKLRTETNIQKGSISVASVAVELAERIFISLKGRNILVIGAGDTAEKSARALTSRGATGLIFTNRSREKAEALATELNGKAINFDQWQTQIPFLDIIISSTSAPNYIVDRHTLEPYMHHRNKPLLLIDLAVPRDINPDINVFDNVFLYDIDDLKEIADEYLKQRMKEVELCEAIIREKVSELIHHRRAEKSST